MTYVNKVKYGKSISFRASLELRKKLEKMAKAEKRSLAKLLDILVNEALAARSLVVRGNHKEQ